MKKVLSCGKTALALLIATVVFLGLYAYAIARPISYGMNYHHRSVYEGIAFEGNVKYYPDGTMCTVNDSFPDGAEARYFYKGGYIFNTMATTDEEYEEETAYIKDNFDEAVNTPFYATTTNAFKQVLTGPDGYTVVYTCAPATVIAVVGGLIGAALIALTATSIVFSRKKEC